MVKGTHFVADLSCLSLKSSDLVVTGCYYHGAVSGACEYTVCHCESEDTTVTSGTEVSLVGDCWTAYCV